MQGSLSRGGGYQPQGDPKDPTLMWQQGHYMGPDSGIHSGAQTQAPSLTGGLFFYMLISLFVFRDYAKIFLVF